ncbi:hypothetical protein A3D78_07065 [Candidatus Gottesmanbacteria bacterium RIFCSPHIGHO2_02_FULL_39_14]|uniref:DUF4352 domain-containing protein n=2 Tax=Candidatus Gottesmaniibacteriota TaxID=1752720 RepID=A0A1F5ZXY1_9BACT|nr:MAG: hypothetical protein A3D78_07065 [Candidatus Gottesmanbacteria bacterium RIFCSPHIGHO2_02_FULL_39_14]OGG30889.1 MAG: hypothetical protein A3I51_04780 [Candidatus Gottesmanbacteria bacterium RIFCSPLOWO2_02_FULL_38_8]
MFKNGWKKKFKDYITRKKRFLIILVVVLVAFTYLNLSSKKTSGSSNGAKTVTSSVDKSFEFPALDNQGKPLKNIIKFKIYSVEKTNQVLVKDQIFTAKNNKLFLIVNLELKNDATVPVNILPGDVIRLSLDNDKETRYAPDLHNNLVPVAAISTKVDRIGFVIPDTAQKFYLFIGEIEGEKQEVSLDFPS